MQDVGSPWADRASALYDLIAGEGDDPAVWLAIGLREHRLLTDPIAVALTMQTHSWTNARSVRLPGLDHDVITTEDLRRAGITHRNGPYIRYRSVEDSLRDGIWRVRDPKYVYQLKFGPGITIGQVLSLWTEDDAGPYTAFVVAKMNEWYEETPVSDVELIPCLIPAGRNNRPGLPLVPRYITIHETANTAVGAHAEMHCRYIRGNEAASRPASWHVTVDDHSAYQHIPTNEVAWHAGDGSNGTGNRQSLAIELCVNADGDWERTMRNAASIVRRWMRDFEIPLERVVQHGHWNKSTSCPARLRAGDWGRFVALLRAEPERPADALYVPGNPFGEVPIVHGFRDLFLGQGRQKFPTDPIAGGLSLFGYPLAPEEPTDYGSRQVFERVEMRWYREARAPWDLVIALRSEAA